MTEHSLDPARPLVLSLKPRFTEAIRAGTKTVEVQRFMLRITDSTLALLYAHETQNERPVRLKSAQGRVLRFPCASGELRASRWPSP